MDALWSRKDSAPQKIGIKHYCTRLMFKPGERGKVRLWHSQVECRLRGLINRPELQKRNHISMNRVVLIFSSLINLQQL